MAIRFDDSEFPLVRAVWEGAPDSDDVAAFGRSLAAIFERRRPMVIVHDMRNGKSPGAKQIAEFADISKDNVENDKLYGGGFAFVITSTIVRIGLKGFFAIQPLAVPTFITDNLADAENWARKRLQERGVTA